MRALIVAAAVTASTTAFAGGNHHTPPPPPAPSAGSGDNWGGAGAHFAASVLAGGACATHIYPNEALKAFGCAMVPGIVKETLDSTQRNGRFSKKDMVANIAGAAVGVYLGGVFLRRHEGTTQIAISVPLK